MVLIWQQHLMKDINVGKNKNLSLILTDNVKNKTVYQIYRFKHTVEYLSTAFSLRETTTNSCTAMLNNRKHAYSTTNSNTSAK